MEKLLQELVELTPMERELSSEQNITKPWLVVFFFQGILLPSYRGIIIRPIEGSLLINLLVSWNVTRVLRTCSVEVRNHLRS